jgi:hypothetical protein
MMQRLTARLLLLLVVVSGSFSPLLQAFSAQPPHACCLRKLHATKDSPLQISDATAAHGNCCPPVTTRQSAQAADLSMFSAALAISSFDLRLADPENNLEFASSLSARAPPTFS